jgi:hypothetical protein
MITTLSRAERDAGLVFRYNAKSKNPATSMHTIHTWSGPHQTRCVCGRFNRDDPRLTTVQMPTIDGLLCKRCTWHSPDAERRLNTPRPS